MSPQKNEGRRKARWLIVADSLAMPRPGVGYEFTWPSLLASMLPEIEWINRAVRGSTTERLHSEGGGGGDCLEHYEPDGVILQLGICDCAPRLLARDSLWTRVVYRLPFGLNRTLTHWLDRRGTRRISNAWVSAQAFERHLDDFLKRAATSNTQVIALEILPVGRAMLDRNPLIAGQIASYNLIYRKLAAVHSHFSSLKAFHAGEESEKYFIDGYHLNAAGGRAVAAALRQSLARSLEGDAHLVLARQKHDLFPGQ